MFPDTQWRKGNLQLTTLTVIRTYVPLTVIRGPYTLPSMLHAAALLSWGPIVTSYPADGCIAALKHRSSDAAVAKNPAAVGL